MSKRDWRELDDATRQDLYQRFVEGEDVVELALEAGLPPQTLSRRLREMRQFAGAPSRERPPVIDTQTATNPPPAKGAVEVLAFPTDAHGPFCDPYAWELALKCIGGMRPTQLVWGSDAMDFGEISHYAKVSDLPSVAEELDDERKRRADLLKEAPGARLWWLADNHVSERYVKYLYNQAPALAKVQATALHKLLGLHSSQMIERFDAGETLSVIHGTMVRKWPGWSVTAEIFDNPGNRRSRTVRSIIMGHVHRFAHVTFDNGIEGLEAGCLQNLRPDYIKANRRHTNWSHGMGFARYGSDWSQIIPAHFVVEGDRLACHLEGKTYSVRLGPSYSGCH